MKRFFTRLWTATALLAGMSATSVADDGGGGNFIYLPGRDAPIVENAEGWSQKMYETSPGSNIFEQTLDVTALEWRNWFRFYYQLTEGLTVETGSQAYALNVIQPKIMPGVNYDGIIPPTAPKNGVFVASDVEKLAVAPANSTWRLPDGWYRMRLDLNTMKLYAVPQGTVLVLINEDTAPDFAKIGDYSLISRINDYIGAGPLSIRLYDLYNGKWLNPSRDNVLAPGSNLVLDVAESDTMGEPFTLTDWQGAWSATATRDGMALTPSTSFPTPPRSKHSVP